MMKSFIKLNFLLLVLIVLSSFFAKKEPKQQHTIINETLSGADILKSLYTQHPRLLAHSSDFAALKNRINTNTILQNWDKKLLKRGEQIIAASPVTYAFTKDHDILNLSRAVLDRMYTLGILYQLHGDKKYGDRAWTELHTASQFPDWNPKHFLDVAEMTHAFAIGYDWFYQYWTPQQRNMLRDQIIKKGLVPAKMAYEGNTDLKSNWVHVTNNWNLVCNGGIGMGALVIADTDPDIAGDILKNVIALLPDAMKKFGPDGGWNEGPMYWEYATRYDVTILASLESALNTDFDLEKVEGFSHTGLFPLYMNGPTNKPFNFSDGSERQIVGSQLFWLANKFNLPSVAQYNKQGIKTPGALDLLWYPTDQFLEKSETLPLSAYFRYTEVASMRGSWNDKNAWFVGFKAGDNKANHSHLDLGSFVLDAFGKRWAVDLGSESYSLPGYFEKSKTSARWSYYRMRAEGHNTLVLNPSEKYDQDPFASAPIQKFESKGNTAFAIADLTSAYQDQASSVRRGITLVDGQTVLIQDEINANGPSKVYWFMHTPAQININPDFRSAVLTIDDQQMQADIISPAKARFSILPARTLFSADQAKSLKQDNISKLTIILNDAKEERITVVLHSIGKINNAVTAFYTPLSNWKLN